MPLVEEPKFKKVGGPKQYYKYTECEPGQVLVVGKYLGRTPNKFGKENFDFMPLDGGQVVCLNHAGQLEKRIEEYVEVGDTVRVTFLGKQVIEKGTWAGKEANQFEVEVAEKELNVEAIKEKQDQLEMNLNDEEVSMADLD